jgi:16S rRNA (guanine966-N2)-methyltransferase
MFSTHGLEHEHLLPRRRRSAAAAEQTPASPPDGHRNPARRVENPPRIIGGTARGRKLLYSGDPRTRPMKQRVREALFNLIAADPPGKHAVDLFAGTGALGLEALSRGAQRATFVERHVPTAALIRRNAEHLGMASRCTVVAADVFYWVRQRPDLGELPWLVFCSPPWELYVQRGRELVDLLGDLLERAPVGSVLIVECDERFDLDQLPDAPRWRRRAYPPAVLAVYRKSPADDAGEDTAA